MNDAADLTDRFQELLDNYSVGDDNEFIVDLDAWNTGDLLDALNILEAIIQIRGEELPVREALDIDLGEYDVMPAPNYDD